MHSPTSVSRALFAGFSAIIFLTPPLLSGQSLSRTYLQYQADHGDVSAQYKLGEAYLAEHNTTQGISYLRRAADQGHAGAAFKVADLLVSANPLDAAHYYRIAADHDSRATLKLGQMYWIGQDGFPKDYKQAVAWLTKAVEQGQRAEYSIAVMNIEGGPGLARDDGEAVRWLKKAVARGDIIAQSVLGKAYGCGCWMAGAWSGSEPPSIADGVLKPDERAGFDLLRSPADQGDPEAQILLGGTLLHNSLGIPENPREAFNWFLRAAKQGVSAAMIVVGALYSAGVDAPHDLVAGYMWLNLASASGDQRTVEARDKLAGELTREELMKGQELTRSFRPVREICRSCEAGFQWPLHGEFAQ